jgi:hypothetical protein
MMNYKFILFINYLNNNLNNYLILILFINFFLCDINIFFSYLDKIECIR